MRLLRNFGIYLLPGVLRPVYAVPVFGGYYLYDTEYGASLPPRFEVRPGGTIVNWNGEEMGWTADDLTDTGKTYGGTVGPS